MHQSAKPPPQDERPKISKSDLRFWKLANGLYSALYEAGVMDEHVDGCLADFPLVNDEVASSPNVRIHGPIGTGKTRLAVGLLRWKYMAVSDNIRFVLAGDLLSEIRETFRDDSKRSEREVVDELCSLGVLVIDDLGREGGFRQRQSSDYVLSVLHRVLSRRIGNDLDTIVTTNLTLDEIETQYDEGIASRLATFREIILTGPDWRRTKAGQR